MAEPNESNIEEMMEKAEAAAKGYFREGLNCSECVFQSFLDLGLTDLPREVIALSSGFGGGIGMTKNTCGALLGAAMSVAAVKGRKDPKAKESMDERIEELYGEGGIYSIFSSLVKEFEEKYGTVSCKEITDVFPDWHSRERKKNCQSIVGYAAALGVKYALK